MKMNCYNNCNSSFLFDKATNMIYNFSNKSKGAQIYAATTNLYRILHKLLYLPR